MQLFDGFRMDFLRRASKDALTFIGVMHPESQNEKDEQHDEEQEDESEISPFQARLKRILEVATTFKTEETKKPTFFDKLNQGIFFRKLVSFVFHRIYFVSNWRYTGVHGSTRSISEFFDARSAFLVLQLLWICWYHGHTYTLRSLQGP